MAETSAPPAFTTVEHSASGLTATVAPDHAARACAGHFPDDPLLPGSAIVELMAAAAQLLAPPDTHASGIARATFRHRIVPTDDIVVVARATEPGMVEAVVHANRREAARGSVRMHPTS